MTGYSWIHPTDTSVLFGRTANLVPIKLSNDIIMELPGNHMMYNSCRDALDDLYLDLSELSIKSAIVEMYSEKPLQWKDKKSYWQYTQSIIARVFYIPMIIIMVPYIKLRYKLLKRYISKEHPEWEI